MYGQIIVQSGVLFCNFTYLASSSAFRIPQPRDFKYALSASLLYSCAVDSGADKGGTSSADVLYMYKMSQVHNSMS